MKQRCRFSFRSLSFPFLSFSFFFFLFLLLLLSISNMEAGGRLGRVAAQLNYETANSSVSGNPCQRPIFAPPPPFLLLVFLAPYPVLPCCMSCAVLLARVLHVELGLSSLACLVLVALLCLFCLAPSSVLLCLALSCSILYVILNQLCLVLSVVCGYQISLLLL